MLQILLSPHSFSYPIPLPHRTSCSFYGIPGLLAPFSLLYNGPSRCTLYSAIALATLFFFFFNTDLSLNVSSSKSPLLATPKKKKNPFCYSNKHLALVPSQHFSCLFIYLFIGGFLPWRCQCHKIRDPTCLN